MTDGWRSRRILTVCAFLLPSLALALLSAVGASLRLNARPKTASKKPLKLIGGIYLPGNPLRFDISWVDQATGRYYLAEAGNAAVDVVDARNDLFLGRITGFHGRASLADTQAVRFQNSTNVRQ